MKKMHLRSLLFLITSLILGSAYSANAQNDTTSARNISASPMDAASFVSKNIRDNRMEIEMAQMAIDKSQNANVKAVAEVLVKDHSDMLQKLTALDKGNASGMTNENEMNDTSTMRSMPGDTGTASNQLDIAGTKTSKDLDTTGGNNMNADTADIQSRLANATGEEFDSLWINQMLTKHKLKLGELHDARKNISDAEVKNLVRNAIPVIRNHRDMLASLKKNPDQPAKMKGQGRDGRDRKEGKSRENRKNRNNASDSTNQ